jgi:serine/threonine-protein kinase
MTVTAQLRAALAGQYHIEREIGAGGMATVYLARDLRHERHVALKVLKPDLAVVLGVERFLTEIRVTANLQHPNLLPLFDSGEVDGLLFYVMPYVEGESLRARLDREKQFPVDDAVRIAVGVANALAYAHAHGVIHRDLKPENILLQAGQPVVADFGIALAVSKAGGNRITQTGLSLGTPQYMSPEQATGDRAIDGRTDIYSLAAVLYEMLTGDPPHTASTAQAVIARMLTERPRPVRTARPTVPDHVAMALERALEKLPADRWPSAHEFAEALQGRVAHNLLPGAATSVDGTSAARRRSTLARARDPVVIGTVGVAAIAVAFALWRGRARADGNGTTVRLAIARSSAGQEIATGTQVAISPDGKFIAYAVKDELGHRQLAVRDVAQLTARLIPGTTGVVAPFFSPDGQWIAFTLGKRLRKVAVSGGPATTIGDSLNVSGASWGSGDTIVAARFDTLIVVSAADGKTGRIRMSGPAPVGERGQRNPRVLADGNTVLYQSWRGSFAESKIGVLSLRTGQRDILDIFGSPVGVIGDILIYGMASGTLMGVPFDLSHHRLTGAPQTLIEQMQTENPGSGIRAALSPSGSLIYASGASTSQVVLVDMQGAARVLVDEPQDYSSPRFSPDGRRLALAIRSRSGTDVWIEDLGSRTPTKLTTEGQMNNRPEWTPDGKRILYQSNRSGQLALWWQNADLSGAAELIESAPGTVSAGVFSPDGQTLLYWINGPGPRDPIDIMYRRVTGDTARKPIAATSAGEITPKFSPDGKWVVYASNQDGPLQVYVQPFPPTGKRYQVSAAGGYAPVWSPDGTRIFYVANGHLSAATVRTSPTFTVTWRSPLFENVYLVNYPAHANYDVSPDGKYLVLLRPVGDGDQLVVVHDWKYELREEMRARSVR